MGDGEDKDSELIGKVHLLYEPGYVIPYVSGSQTSLVLGAL
jgi:hypothetical protein